MVIPMAVKPDGKEDDGLIDDKHYEDCEMLGIAKVDNPLLNDSL